MKNTILRGLTVPLLAVAALAAAHAAEPDRANILMIMTDDVGYFNVGAYNLGMMGVPTPNIDRLARQGILFTDHYAEP